MGVGPNKPVWATSVIRDPNAAVLSSAGTACQLTRHLRPTRQAGFALPLAMSLLATITLLVLAMIAFATHSTDRANHDRDAARALAAADAGLDAAVYRMNKALVSSQVQGVFGLTSAVLAETKCVSLSVGQLTLTNPLGNGWCAASSGATTEAVDGAAQSGQNWVPASFSYTVSNGVNLGTDPSNSQAHLIERKVVSTGFANGLQKRVIGTVRLQLGATGNLLSLFQEIGYKQCTAEPPTPANPSRGARSNG